MIKYLRMKGGTLIMTFDRRDFDSLKRLSPSGTVSDSLSFDLHWLNVMDASEALTNQTTQMHYHNFFELHFLLKGKMTYLIEDATCELDEGTCIVIAPGYLHGVESYSSDLLKFSMTFLVGTDDPLYTMIVAKSGHICSADPFKDSIRFMCDIASSNISHAEYVIKNRAFEILCLMCGSLKNEKRHPSRNFLSKDGDMRLFKAKRFIEDNAQLYLGCEDVASYVGISSKQLGRIFLRYEGISLRDYIHKKKAEEAKRMLEETDLPLAMISDGLGFSGVCYFNNFFVKHFGISPGKYRKNKEKTVMSKMKLLSFGEIIWDIFDKEEHIGGAPLNFAAHAARQGADAWIASAVGNDELGKRALSKVRELGVGTELVRVVNDLPSGSCTVTLDENSLPHYDLADPAAYDRIDIPDSIKSMHFDYLAFGTLALRHEHNKSTVKKIIALGVCDKIFADVNIRPPFFDKESVFICLENANIVKISDEELPTVTELVGISEKNVENSAVALSKEFKNIEIIVITLGEKGSLAYDCEEKKFFRQGAIIARVVSTVGAGDSFGATLLVSIHKKDPIEKSLHKASSVSSFVVSKTGALPEYNEDLLEELKK